MASKGALFIVPLLREPQLTHREQLEDLKRAQDLNQTQRQLDQLRHQAASRPGLAAQPRTQQLHETQKQVDQLKLEQQLRELELQQQMQFLQDQSRTKLMQQELNRLR